MVLSLLLKREAIVSIKKMIKQSLFPHQGKKYQLELFDPLYDNPDYQLISSSKHPRILP